ncbi:MAG: carboxylating nicotinate-nucleotide diphosphorylase [Elusimicrobia bacterium]|nr:carboxylating nicotinate-nucleotide diphosphorylase [Elusimicrobiota bacterium]
MRTERLIRLALREDLGSRGDLTTRFFVPPGLRLKGRVVAKADGVVCGAAVAARVFRSVCPRCRVRVLRPDGRAVRRGQVIMTVEGGREIMSAERTALNFLQHLSGIATLTRRFVLKTRGTRARIYDTRKTLPGWRELAKYAVRCGGGRNHRMGLYDAVLVKDNHWSGGPDLESSARLLRRSHPRVPIQIEAKSLGQVQRALSAGADMILLDNMATARLKDAIALIRGRSPRTRIEISGGVTLSNVRGLAKLGPDRISIGRLTHSAPALDMSLEIP